MATLNAETQAKVEKLLVEQSLLTSERVEALKSEASNLGEPFFVHLVKEGAVAEEDLTRSIAEVAEVPYVDLRDFEIKPEVLALLSASIARKFMAIPLGEMEGKLAVAMLDGNNVQAVDYLSSKIGRSLKVYMASQTSINNSLNQYKTDLEGGVSGVIDQTTLERESTGPTNIKKISQDSPVSKALNAILEYAAKSGASDVHAEPFENEFKIRVRVDGVLREIMKLPRSIEPAFISRIKILAGLKIDEHRVPQDGQFAVEVAGREIDLRIAVSPVIWGEQAVIRLLDKAGKELTLEGMGYKGRALRVIRKAINQPHGMIITSGPTGSGKSTSLYTLIKEIKNDTINIVTLEDPVEYKMEGVNQIQVNERVGLTFANGLRSILRQDPDVIMVGEIRDEETARLAIQASLTGHLVFSTLHTNSAAGVLPRLIDMGIEPFLIASTMRAIIGQRLVRKISDKYEEYDSSAIETTMIKDALRTILPTNGIHPALLQDDLGYDIIPDINASAFRLKKGKDSPATPGGYAGRVGIYEVIDVNDEIEQLILAGAPSSAIEAAAIKNGLVTMRQDGYMKVVNGLTSIEEVNRVTAEGDDEENTQNSTNVAESVTIEQIAQNQTRQQEK